MRSRTTVVGRIISDEQNVKSSCLYICSMIRPNQDVILHPEGTLYEQRALRGLWNAHKQQLQMSR